MARVFIEIEDRTIGRLIQDIAAMAEDESLADIDRRTIEGGLFAIKTIVSKEHTQSGKITGKSFS